MVRISVMLLLVVFACATSNLLGGFEDVDVNDEGVLNAGDYFARDFDKSSSSKYRHKLVKVVKAKRQFDVGYDYKLDIIVGMTNCKKQEVSYEEAKDCDIQNGATSYKLCLVSIFADIYGKYPSMGYGCVPTSKNGI